MKFLFAAMMMIFTLPAMADIDKGMNLYCKAIDQMEGSSPVIVNLSLNIHGGSGTVLLPFIEGSLACAHKDLDRESIEVSCVGMLQIEGGSDERLVKLELAVGDKEGKGILSGRMLEETTLPRSNQRVMFCRAQN
jgi:hypothetical protein